jgi:hypothetical protein
MWEVAAWRVFFCIFRDNRGGLRLSRLVGGTTRSDKNTTRHRDEVFALMVADLFAQAEHTHPGQRFVADGLASAASAQSLSLSAFVPVAGGDWRQESDLFGLHPKDSLRRRLL